MYSMKNRKIFEIWHHNRMRNRNNVIYNYIIEKHNVEVEDQSLRSLKIFV